MESVHLRGPTFSWRIRIRGALPSESSFCIHAASPCTEFLYAAALDHPRMGNGAMGPHPRAPSVGSGTRRTRGSSDRSRLSPSLRRTSFKHLHDGMGPLDFPGTGSLDSTRRLPMAAVGECGGLPANSSGSGAILLF